MLLYQSLYDLTDRTVCNLKSVLVLTNALGRNLISVLDLTNSLGCNLISVYDLTNPLGRRPISALVLTSHLKCQAILMILLCLAAPFFNRPRLFLFSIEFNKSYLQIESVTCDLWYAYLISRAGQYDDIIVYLGM